MDHSGSSTNMSENFFVCLFKFYSNPDSMLSSILEFVFVLIVILLGIMINLMFRNKLLEEKKQKPIGRRGNVIAPVMELFCILQMIYWPFDLLLIWEATNEIVPIDFIHPYMCQILLLTLKCGRVCIAYNSLFVALIRYIHIVHDKIANQWNYEIESRRFKFASIFVPLAMETVGYFFYEFNDYTLNEKIRKCVGFSEHTNANTSMKEVLPGLPVNWTMNYLPFSWITALSFIYISIQVIVAMNIIEAYLYVQIFKTMKSSNENSYKIQIIQENDFEYGNKRRLVSLKICFMGWLYEIVGVVLTLLTPLIKELISFNVSYVDAVLMFVILPATFFINDEDTKTVITDEGWIEGGKYMLGKRNLVPSVAPIAGSRNRKNI